MAGHRKIVEEVAGLCRGIAGRHPGKKLGVIGLCLTGSFPLELLAEPEMPPLAAPVLSQPSIPILPQTYDGRQSLGIPDAKLMEIRELVRRRRLTVLGFRAELDAISPPERFAHIQWLLGSSFVDATLPASQYIYRDGCPPTAHAVLTDMFTPFNRAKPETEGHFAWRRLVWFLGERLKGRHAPAPVRNDYQQAEWRASAELAKPAR